VELTAPIITEECRRLNFTNEVGCGGTIRLLKNIVGLWIVQECRRSWAAQGNTADYGELAAMAEGSQPFRSFIHPADARFISPDAMPEKIAAFCRETGQPAPETPGQTMRCALESLALLYRQTLNDLERLTGRSVTVLHIVGGGSRNTLLNQFAANALQIPVLAGPVEATATGNILVQAILAGQLQSLGHARELVRQSCPVRRYEPCDSRPWNEAYQRFQALDIHNRRVNKS
jgi:rhamnulokinase